MGDTMAIFKAKIQTEYTVIPNAAAQDNTLSFEARGLLVMLLSLPESWEIHKDWIIKQTSAGRDKVNRMVNELCEHGYIVKVTSHDKKGKLTGWDWFVYPYSTVRRVSRTTVKPNDGKTTPIKETELESKDSNKVYVEQARQCLEYLNQKLGTKYQSTTKSHIENIKARLETGNTVDDIKLVIDSKSEEWGSDPKMCQYLRPGTMFIPKNFDGYLLKAKTEKTAKPSLQKPTNDHQTGGFTL
jgi:uncharacterized phage protein (TIGR02220 family)